MQGYQNIALSVVAFAGVALFATPSLAQGIAPSWSPDAKFDAGPIIDVHFHGSNGDGGFPMCPNTTRYLASDPMDKEATYGRENEAGCAPMLQSKPGEFMKDVLAQWEKFNITAVVIGGPEQLRNWKAAAPSRVIPATGFSIDPSRPTSIEELKKVVAEQGVKVFGEIGFQSLGLSPSDPAADQYFALAEQLDIPVAIHMGTGGAGRSNVSRPSYRAAMGNPLLLEDMLARHPKLRVQVMHAGYPMMENMLALLGANSHVYVDISGLNWSYPLSEVNGYIKRLVDAGFGDRVMYGSDGGPWPELIPYTIDMIRKADYLTPQQKRDILYNNAARFLRLDRQK
jgi:uncharacterized protein